MVADSHFLTEEWYFFGPYIMLIIWPGKRFLLSALEKFFDVKTKLGLLPLGYLWNQWTTHIIF